MSIIRCYDRQVHCILELDTHTCMYMCSWLKVLCIASTFVLSCARAPVLHVHPGEKERVHVRGLYAKFRAYYCTVPPQTVYFRCNQKQS